MMKKKQTTSSTSEIRTDDETKYKGVRKRKWGKWVSEIRLPNSRERIWLGSYDSPEKAARAFDAALFCLRGRNAKFNFPDNPPDIPGGRHLPPAEIQAAASRFANSASTSEPPRSHSDSELQMDHSPSASEGNLHMDLIWDTVGPSNNTNINSNCNNNYGYDNINNSIFPGQCSGSGPVYPTEYGIFQGFDDLSSDFYVPTMPPVDNAEENFDTSLSHGSCLWNF